MKTPKKKYVAPAFSSADFASADAYVEDTFRLHLPGKGENDRERLHKL